MTSSADPRQHVCPACNAQPGEACTQPTDTSRKPVTWVHLAREKAAGDAQQAGQ